MLFRFSGFGNAAGETFGRRFRRGRETRAGAKSGL